jgi:hypothetical protein
MDPENIVRGKLVFKIITSLLTVLVGRMEKIHYMSYNVIYVKI